MDEEYNAIVNLSAELHNKVKVRQERISRRILECSRIEAELLRRKGKVELEIASKRVNLEMMRNMVERKRNTVAQMKRMLQLGPGILEEGVEDVKDKNKVMRNLDKFDRGIFGKASCDVGRRDLCEGRNKEEEEVTVAVVSQKKPKLSDDERDDKDKMRQQLMQLQEAMHEKQSAVIANSHNPKDNLGTGEVSTRAVATKRCHHHRPVNWVAALHQEARREALRLAYMEIKTDIHSPRPRIQDQAGKCVTFNDRVETSDGGFEILKMNLPSERWEMPLSGALKRCIEE